MRFTNLVCPDINLLDCEGALEHATELDNSLEVRQGTAECTSAC